MVEKGAIFEAELMFSKMYKLLKNLTMCSWLQLSTSIVTLTLMDGQRTN